MMERDVHHATVYSDVARRSLRSTVRSLALTTLATVGNRFSIIQDRLRTHRVHFLYLHHIFRDEEANFERLIRWLTSSGHSFISYSKAVQHVSSGPIDKPYVSFSFDDGFDNSLRAGQVLNRHGISACYFLNTDTISKTHNMIRHTYLYGNRASLPLRYLNWSEVEELQKLGHEIGGHTHSHINMAQIDKRTLDEEVQKNKVVLEKRVGTIHHFAWPFGRYKYFSYSARESVFESNYLTCASAERGAHVTVAGHKQFCIHRDNIVAAWPLAHIQYLLGRSVAKSGTHTNTWSGLEELHGKSV
jgi:peptidoglycan/xylan/chitin deacetylase (PgdA/CDA1 family)